MGAAAIAGGALALGGGLLAAKAQMDAAKSKAKELRLDAKLQQLQSDKLLRSARIQAQRTRRVGKQIEGEIVSTAGQSGVAIEGTPLALMEANAADVAEEIALIGEATEFKRFMISQGISAKERAASNITKAGRIQAMSTILGAGSRAASFAHKGKSSNSLNSKQTDFSEFDAFNSQDLGDLGFGAEGPELGFSTNSSPSYSLLK